MNMRAARVLRRRLAELDQRLTEDDFADWVTAVVAGLVTFLAGIRRIFNWHADWLAQAQAWSRASALVSQYRLLRADQRTEEKQRELVAAIDDLVVEETYSWGRRRRQLLRPESSSAPA